MFYYISGKLAYLELSYAVIDAGGVGYRLTISQNTYFALPHRIDLSESIRLYTYMAVRDDGVELFGFHSTEELDAFKLLITVSGIGPKAAISILSQLSPAALSRAILSDDKKSIALANGIGVKTAARIVLELKDKLKKTEFGGMLANSDSIPSAIGTSSKFTDAQDALLALGYTRSESSTVLKTIDVQGLELDEIIRLALKKLMR